MNLMPILLVGIAFGPAMHREVFLVARMREAYVHRDRPGQAVVTGFRYSARVVVAAALIMVAGFVGAREPMNKAMGFGLASAVLLEAFVVRMTFVPALLGLLGRSAWWLPPWLDHPLPVADVEGESLGRHPAALTPPPEQEAAHA